MLDIILKSDLEPDHAPEDDTDQEKTHELLKPVLSITAFIFSSNMTLTLEQCGIHADLDLENQCELTTDQHPGPSNDQENDRHQNLEDDQQYTIVFVLVTDF